MKRINYLLCIFGFLSIVITPVLANTEDVNVNVNADIRAKIRADYENRLKNVRNNQDYRNEILDERRSTTTKPVMMRYATSTWATSTKENMKDKQNEMRGMKDDRKEFRDELLNMSKKRAIMQLEQGLRNLKQIRSRIATRIQKAESEGRNMTSPKSLLVTADLKIKSAETAIVTLRNIGTASTTVAANASTTVNIEAARVVYKTALQTLREAQKALNDVVVAIAHNMGLKLSIGKDMHASTTTSVSASSTIKTNTNTQ